MVGAKDQIPVVDLAPFLAGAGKEGALVVESVRRACEEIGFFITTGHGLAGDLIAEMYDSSRAFFDLPATQKSGVAETGTEAGGLMYFPFQAERLAGTRGEKTPGDLKETLDYGPGFLGDAWPDEPPDLKRNWEAYYRALSDLAADIRRIFAVAIGLPEAYFEHSFDRHLSTLRVLNYPDPEQPPLPGQLRAGEHTDYGILTILRSEDAPGGLQVKNRDGQWLDVPAVPEAFVVNIGDAMMRWTNDRWVSTPHRVVNPAADSKGSCRRQSIAFFNNPNRDAVIECLPAFCGPADPPKYDPITYGAFAERRYKQAHGDHKTLALASARKKG